jgi:hypothetical protein
MYVLAKYAERYDASSYGSLIRRALGRKTGAGLSAVTVLYLWGSSVAYLVSSYSRSGVVTWWGRCLLTSRSPCRGVWRAPVRIAVCYDGALDLKCRRLGGCNVHVWSGLWCGLGLCVAGCRLLRL